MSINTLSGYLVTKVKNINGVKADAVLPYENPAMSSYPWISITLKDFTGKYADTGRNVMDYTFTIRIYQEVSNTNMGANLVESNLQNLMDAIVASFSTDNRLGSNDVYTTPASGKSGWLGNTPIRIYEVDIVCHDVIPAVG